MRRETFADIWGSVWHNHVLAAGEIRESMIHGWTKLMGSAMGAVVFSVALSACRPVPIATAPRAIPLSICQARCNPPETGSRAG